MLKRSSGVLINVSQFPSDYGIGDFSFANKLIEIMKENGFHWWQTLPITSIGLGDSPYSGLSAFAGNFLYIDINQLAEDGYISNNDAINLNYCGSPHKIDYQAVKEIKTKAIKIAFSNANKNAVEIAKFKNANPWVEDYSFYVALKKVNDNKAWWEWDEKYKIYNKKNLQEFAKNNKDLIDYYIFEQFLFDTQWNNVRKLFKDAGMKILGDMPIYVALDSCDVWSNTENFLLDEKHQPTLVAGVPPDYFCAEGQLWGNPIYNYENMKKDNFGWFKKRLERMFYLYDTVRIDHFRAFDRFWGVQFGNENAINGKWYNGVGRDLFNALKIENLNEKIIAEDLGIIDDGVRQLLKDLNLSGMRVLQFGFSDGDSIHLPHNLTTDCLGYTGTHDNDTTLGWLQNLNKDIQDYVLKYFEIKGDWWKGGCDSVSLPIINKALIKSSCLISFFPMQDLLAWGSDTRLNIPGVADGNWAMRFSLDSFNQINKPYYFGLNCLYGRNQPLD